jgi:tetratricopeptide (TPR) repeat protein
VLHARYEKAETLLERALAGAGESREERARSQVALARVARELGDLPLARERLAAARALAAQGLAPAELVRLDLESAWLALAEGREAEAANAFELAGALAASELGEADRAVAWAEAGRGEALRRLGDRAAAEATLRDALVRFRGDANADAVTPEDPLGLLAVLTSLGALRRGAGQLEDARSDLRDALAIGAREVGTEHPRYADALAELALVELARGDLEAARRAAARADEIARSRLPEGHATRLAAADALARCGAP